MENNKINIAFASDDNYAQHMTVAMASVLKNTLSPIQFYILDNGISDEKKKKITRTVASFKSGAYFLKVDDAELDSAFLSGHLSKAAYSRVLLANLLPKEIQKIIYLDVDLIIKKDIKELWQENLENRPLGAVLDLGLMCSRRMQKAKKTSLDIDIFNEGYFNSGVLVLDIAKWRQYNYGSQLLDLINKNDFLHHDQDALNKLFLKKWKKLPLKWNVIPPVYYLFPKILFSNRFKKMAKEAKDNLAIMHFAGRIKPWEFKKTIGYNEMYYKYLAYTEFRDEKMPKPSKDMKGKSVKRQVWRGRIARFLNNL